MGNNNLKELIVCIHCMTYNHEKYLADALEGFVMQKTNFPFVAVVIDDFSTDGTADILRKYETKYPDIIKAVYLQENYYSQRKSKQPFLEPYDSQSKYIAICEGDDYWTDPLKLQKQVDFLENHPDYSMCFHAAEIKNESDITNISSIGYENLREGEYGVNDVFPNWMVPTASIVYRKDSIAHFKISHSEWATAGDIILVEKCAHTGKLWAFAKQMSVYRYQSNGATISSRYDNSFAFRQPKHFRMLYKNFPLIDKSTIRWIISAAYYTSMRHQKNPFLILRDFVLMSYWSPKCALSKFKNAISK